MCSYLDYEKLDSSVPGMQCCELSSELFVIRFILASVTVMSLALVKIVFRFVVIAIANSAWHP